MVIKYINKLNIPKIKPSVACIGYFDGLHLGHKELINKTLNIAKQKKISSTLICFNPDPIDVIKSENSKHILSFDERLKLIELFGIDQVVVINFNEEFMRVEPIEFIYNYLNALNIDTLICGFDFKYGYKGKGCINQLKKYSNSNIEVVDEFKYYNKKVSSTRIKQAIIKGNFKLVNRLLGYQYQLTTIVEKCSKIGKKWLVEANLYYEDTLIPLNYRFSNNLYIKDGKIYIKGNYKVKKNHIVYVTFE